MSGPELTLESLLAPVTLDEFFSDYWEKAPLVISRREPAWYQALLELSDIDSFSRQLSQQISLPWRRWALRKFTNL